MCVMYITFVKYDMSYFHHTDTYVVHTPGRSGKCVIYFVRNDGFATIPIYLDYRANHSSIYSKSLSNPY